MAAYLAEKPDWVFMDVEMPVVDGLTATRELTRRFPSSRVVIVTHHREDDLRAAAFEQGACGFVLKDDLQQIRALLVDDDPGRQRIP